MIGTIDFEDDAPSDPRAEIARLESLIEELEDKIERCRKLALFARALVVAGTAWLAAALIGLANLGAPQAMGAIAAILGGFILGGSNRSTTMQMEDQLEAAEERRRTLIGMIELRLVKTGHKPSQLLH